MERINTIYARLLFLLTFLFAKVRLCAQEETEDDEIDEIVFGREGIDEFSFFEKHELLNIGVSDVIIFVLVLICCYAVGRIWKGLSYLFLCLAALVYYHVIH